MRSDGDSSDDDSDKEEFSEQVGVNTNQIARRQYSEVFDDIDDQGPAAEGSILNEVRLVSRYAVSQTLFQTSLPTLGVVTSRALPHCSYTTSFTPTNLLMGHCLYGVPLSTRGSEFSHPLSLPSMHQVTPVAQKACIVNAFGVRNCSGKNILVMIVFLFLQMLHNLGCVVFALLAYDSSSLLSSTMFAIRAPL
ncbi:hypothetical protein QCA50_020539 [Cerrena zonata]|uniref:Uncharacterized protein n=1 Tax=Cerrena zonata TaxID=2478898 RepID=A0AAW0F9D8_9APHY